MEVYNKYLIVSKCLEISPHICFLRYSYFKRLTTPGRDLNQQNHQNQQSTKIVTILQKKCKLEHQNILTSSNKVLS